MILEQDLLEMKLKRKLKKLTIFKSSLMKTEQ